MAPKEYSDAEIADRSVMQNAQASSTTSAPPVACLTRYPAAAWGSQMQKLINPAFAMITLTPDEQLVYDAILRKRLPGGGVRLISRPKPDQDSQDG